ncbi:hypothetical protein COV53_00220 [Candidatus Gottesmanbacteria bacterium CG11_big_fil_rev_8_21_14_0_20_37_11]|uniref:Uncharacterized protein n=3 Tax=Microgenomates group TaxID=1794810 RepID=A0A2M7EJP0_9BACT|nr:MAG: hypothetical protein COV53_00220 [Candidatus Gottesmanbacteria bacterium CG11_big_fil_rev_8_21_14_0_20_37_11]PIV70772.1 MAG: hypothetical protein COW57_03385 [Candidatus Roizmanbacteria bacterium CG17_big_fil_post_rev_8_21_14_2_50_39_7]PJC81233.1 MAG: hypothetical protein CO007_05780 [Candidatus Roizmanbacteria bacterium CG_4_8_14_3_um_filter_36_10]
MLNKSRLQLGEVAGKESGVANIVIIFWPQYLPSGRQVWSILGLCFLFLTFGGIVFWRRKKMKIMK